MAEQALEPAFMATPVEVESLIDWEKSMIKYGGTKRAKLPTAPTRKNQGKGMQLKSDQTTKAAPLNGMR